MNTIVVGGGPAGMLAAISAAYEGDNVTILEKMNSCGRKLLITGKGRCNITSSLEMDEHIKNIPGNGKFLYSAFQNFTNRDIIDLLKKHGVEVKNERGNRVFPVADKSQVVLNALLAELKSLNVEIRTNTTVTSIIVDENNSIKGVSIGKSKEIIKADKVILATGGRSYPATGSTGDGYSMAKNLGHTITPLKASLVPIELFEDDIYKELQGLSLKNVSIKFKDNNKNKEIYEDFGEMIFTHFGVSGPTILSGSAILLRYSQIDELMNNKKIKLLIDLKPALTNEQLDLRIRRDFEEIKNKQFKNSLDKLLPQKLIPIVIKLSKINEHKQVNEITREERINIVRVIKNLEFTVKKFRPIDEAIITAGGVSIKEINPKTMESKLVSGLYFAGEIIDVDAYTGGFNLQIAYSTGYAAGRRG